VLTLGISTAVKPTAMSTPYLRRQKHSNDTKKKDLEIKGLDNASAVD
jgi:hypothetical protein